MKLQYPLLFVLVACSKESSPPEARPVSPGSAVQPLPSKIAAFVPKPAKHDAAAELGRSLFFDPRLSGDNTMSCASCHDQDKGWSDGLPTSKGKDGASLRRNAPSIVNIDMRAPFFWDGRAPTAEAQALGPVIADDEMAQDPNELVAELERVPEYIARFAEAYGDGPITIERVGAALASFERTVVSANSKLDRFLAGQRDAMSAEEQRGFELFVGKGLCVKCHDGPHLTDASFHNIGVRGTDPGRYGILKVDAVRGAFKTPGLRDIEHTAPYFHDGSAATLEAVIDHYDRGGDTKDNLDPDIKPLDLAPDEKRALVAFMRALSGAPQRVQQPRIPQVNEKPRPITTLQLMKDVDGMLDNLDTLLAKLADGRWDDASASVDKLIDISEELATMRQRLVVKGRQREVSLYVGKLLVEFVRLQQSIGAHDLRGAKLSYKAVRDRCENCHEAFRSKGK